MYSSSHRFILASRLTAFCIFLCVIFALSRAFSEAALSTQLSDENRMRSEALDYIQAVGVGTPVRVTMEDSKLTLTGEVESLEAAWIIKEAAERTRGVQVVHSQLEVASPRLPDEDLKNSIMEVYSENPRFGASASKVIVKDGEAYLSGTTASHGERLLVEREIQSIRGLRAVHNEMVVEAEKTVSDEERVRSIRLLFETASSLKGASLEVESVDGGIVLSGTVVCLAERNLAERVALLLGADRVDVKRISICAPSAAKEAARLDNSTLSDDRIRHAVILALELNPWIVRLPEKVEVRGGVVEISGEVESLAEKEAVKRMAERIVGVACVNENLRVRPGKKIDDRELARRAISALRRDAQLGDSKIDVSVINGKVFLTGSLEAPHRKAHAERLVGRIHGVIEISSRVTPQIGAASSSI